MQGFNYRSFEKNQKVKNFHEKVGVEKSLRKVVSHSVSGNSGGASVGKYDVQFPRDYNQLLQQVSLYFGIVCIWPLPFFFLLV